MTEKTHFLDRFFNPESVAVIGVTDNPYKINFPLLKNLVDLNFKGKIYPINSHVTELLGVKTFARLQDVPGKIDLAVSAVPVSKTMDIVKDCVEVGIKQLVIITGGFSEAGEIGQELNKELTSFVKGHDIRVLGPNTLSPDNTSNNLIISFHVIEKTKQSGISFGFQSGFFELRAQRLFTHYGVNKILDMGNKMDINEVDAMEYFSKDPDTRVIAMHIESLHGNGRDFFNILKNVSRKKPTIILKSGRTQTGSMAAASHTGAIASENDLIFDSMIRQTAAIRAQNIDEFFDLAKAFEFLELPRGNRLAIIPFSGGEGVMTTDTSDINGIKMSRLGAVTKQRLKEILPQWEISLNPFDLGVSFQFFLSDLPSFYETLIAIPEDENVDFAIMQMPPPMLYSRTSVMEDNVKKEEFVKMFVNMKKAGKPVAMWCCTTMSAYEMELTDLIEAHHMPVFQSSERAIKALAAMYNYTLRSRSV